MTTFAITSDNNITAYTSAEQAPEGQPRLATEKELAKATAEWPIARFAEVWNSFAGVVPFDDLKPVKKFTDRKTAVARIWKAIQRLGAPAASPAAPAALKKAEADTPAAAAHGAPVAREGSKKAIVIDLLKRPGGATLQEIMSVTGWMAHSVRGFISGGLGKKMDLSVESLKTESGDRVYHIKVQ